MFLLKSQLPRSTQAEIDRVLAIPAGKRTAKEAAFLVALAPYLTNEVIDRDADGLILRARGLTVPDEEAGFAKGALFIKKDAAGNALYMNIGDEAEAEWDLVEEAEKADVADGAVTLPKLADDILGEGEILVGDGEDPSRPQPVAPSGDVEMDKDGVTVIQPGVVDETKLASELDLAAIALLNLIKVGTPVNAVGSLKDLVFSGLPVDNEIVTIDGVVYTFQSDIGAGVAASVILNVTGTPSEGDTVTIGFSGEEVVYKMRAAIGAGAYASKVLTLSGVAVDGEDVTLGTKTYDWVDDLTEAKATGILTATGNPHDGARVTIGSTVYTFRDTLGAAYDVKIGALATDSLDNLIAAINKAAGEGTLYGTGTVAHPDVVAAAGAGDTMDVTAKVVGIAGNLVTTVEYSPLLSWGAGTMTGGVDPIANEVLVAGTAELCIDNLVAAINGATGEGTTYSTGTVANDLAEAVKASASEMTAIALEVGLVGNAIDIAENMTNGAWAGGAVKLSGGVDPQAPYDVLIGINAEAAIDNLVLAITAGAGEGTNYGTGTEAHPDVTAVKKDADEMTITALVAGENGENILVLEVSESMNFGGKEHLEGGEGEEAPYDVLIDDTPEHTLENLIAAITAGAGGGTKYGSGTVVHPTVTATKKDASTVTATAKIKGVSGNLIEISENATNVAWSGGATKLSGGIDGTVGAKNEMLIDPDYLYIAIDVNTVADTNWRKITLEALA